MSIVPHEIGNRTQIVKPEARSQNGNVASYHFGLRFSFKLLASGFWLPASGFRLLASGFWLLDRGVVKSLSRIDLSGVLTDMLEFIVRP